MFGYNSSVNVTLQQDALPNNCPYPQRTQAARIAKIFAYSLIMVMAFVGNILVIAVVYRNRHMRRSINYFIVNISVSDLIVPAVVLPRILVELSHDSPAWLLSGTAGVATCKLVYFLSDISPIVSILSLIFMTVDRFCAVVFPLRVGLITSRRRYILIIATWVVAACFASPYFYAMKLKPTHSGENACQVNWGPVFSHVKAQKAYSTASSIVFLVLPFIILTTLYSIILVKSRSQGHLTRHRSTVGRRSEQQTSRRLTLMALTIVLVFGLCWGPLNIFLFLLVFVWEFDFPTFCGWQPVLLAVQFLSFSNAAINPCIIFLLIRNFREGLRHSVNRFSSKGRDRIPAKTLSSDSLRLRRHSASEIRILKTHSL